MHINPLQPMVPLVVITINPLQPLQRLLTTTITSTIYGHTAPHFPPYIGALDTARSREGWAQNICPPAANAEEADDKESARCCALKGGGSTLRMEKNGYIYIYIYKWSVVVHDPLMLAMNCGY